MTPLSEAQVQRYSRQILLKEVGGRGQRRLLSSGFVAEGQSPALDVAVAYLSASGTPVRTRAPHEGFLAGVRLADFAPDATREAPLVGWLGGVEALAGAPGDLHRVALGPAVVVAVRAGVTAPAVEPGAPRAESVSHGALAALVAQRLVLGLESADVVELRWDAGRWTRVE